MPRTRNGAPQSRRRKRAVKKDAPSNPVVKEQAPSGESTSKGEKKRLNMIERVQLAHRIAEARTKPKPDAWATIAKREDQPIRTLQYTYARFLANQQKLGDSTGGPVLEETLLLYEEAIARCAHEAEFGDNTAARVGAVRTLLDAKRGQIELLAVMGRMPRSFRAMDELAMLNRLVRRMAEIVERNNMPPDVVREFLALVDEIQPVIEGSADVRALPRAS